MSSVQTKNLGQEEQLQKLLFWFESVHQRIFLWKLSEEQIRRRCKYCVVWWCNLMCE